MATRFDYSRKFDSYRDTPLYERLDRDERDFVRAIAFEYRLTLQEFRFVAEACRDLAMWGEEGLEAWWRTRSRAAQPAGRRKRRLLESLRSRLAGLKAQPKRYAGRNALELLRRERKPVVTERSDKAIFGMCPVASDKTVCCNLRTIDAVENCVFGCSYCSVQTFYGKDIVFDADFAAKLEAIPIEPDRFYHIGTGQSSDALAWGNRNGILDALCRFAGDHPNVLLELKTKSRNVGYFTANDVPTNVVCSWSLNTPAIIANEEHFTADLEERLDAARRVADHGVKVGFHFHPMVYYDRWDVDYPRVASTLIERFKTDEVLFISFGSVTLTKPVVRKIRELGNPSKILQMEIVSDPHGKLTYPDAIKIEMFRTIHRSLEPWHDRVFMYLCMEKRSIWLETFGRVYETNSAFEEDFGGATMGKLP